MPLTGLRKNKNIGLITVIILKKMTNMGKISKYSNLYDKNCTSDNLAEHIIKRVNDNNVLQDYTSVELEQLADKLGNDKDDSGKIKNKQAFNNVSSMLFHYYQKYGNPHEEELKQLISKARPVEEQKKEALNTVMDEYVDYEKA